MKLKLEGRPSTGPQLRTGMMSFHCLYPRVSWAQSLMDEGPLYASGRLLAGITELRGVFVGAAQVHFTGSPVVVSIPATPPLRTSKQTRVTYFCSLQGPVTDVEERGGCRTSIIDSPPNDLP
ncbi:uncharacterized protein ARMOST_00003 [Armillaria ostoyae]|uniref:Uncharacterized protein n=1 Tax=Armillaria ostoyae TaxID=47428 RepID=A0A284QJW8_ARMOS|nr:uncharacterized protein ARMOST_00003 [Armillaria ostoyae]